MHLYMEPDDVAKTIGVEAQIVKSTLERRDTDIEPYLHVVSGQPEDGSDTLSTQLQIRVDGLAPLIKKLSYNIPTDEIIENLICQIVHLTYLQEANEELENQNQELIHENQQLKQTVASLDKENRDLQEQVDENHELHMQVDNLTTQLQEKATKTWVNRWFSGKE